MKIENKSLRYLTLFLMTLGLTLSMFSGDAWGQPLKKFTWFGGGDDNLWSNPDNWSPTEDAPPDVVDETVLEWAQFDRPSTVATYPAVIDDSFNGSVQRTNFGLSGGDATVNMIGGSLTVTPGGFWINRNTAPGVNSTFNMSGGTMTVEGNFRFCDSGGDNGNIGTFNLSDGVFEVKANTGGADDSEIGRRNGFAFLNISGGVFKAVDFIVSDPGLNGYGNVTITGGQLIISGDLTVNDPTRPIELQGGEIAFTGNEVNGKAKTAIDNGDIVSFDGIAEIDVAYDSENDLTVLTPGFFFNPVPENGTEALFDTISELSWTVPEPNTPGNDVLITVIMESEDPNLVLVDNVKDASSVLFSPDPSTDYVWRIISRENGQIIHDQTFTFTTQITPIVTLSSDPLGLWLQDGAESVTLTGTVVDDDPGSLTTTWSQLSGPTAAPNSPSSLVTTVDFTETGTYVYQLEVQDPTHTVTETITVTVYGDACTAAKSVPGYQKDEGDINNDCVVDLKDFNELSLGWMSTTRLMD